MSTAYRTRYSTIGGVLGVGLPSVELWGVAQRDLSRPRRTRSDGARARRRARAAAKKQGVPLKAHLRRKAAA
jgi:hypothetical protein